MKGEEIGTILWFECKFGPLFQFYWSIFRGWEKSPNRYTLLYKILPVLSTYSFLWGTVPNDDENDKRHNEMKTTFFDGELVGEKRQKRKRIHCAYLECRMKNDFWAFFTKFVEKLYESRYKSGGNKF